MRTILYLNRLIQFDNDGPCLGELRTGLNVVLCNTLELPYKDNKPFVSSIKPGTYDVKPWTSPSVGKCFQFAPDQVGPDREHILLHKGNRLRDTKGCCLCGSRVGYLEGEVAVLQSKAVLDWLLEKYQDGFTVVVNGVR